MAALLATNSTFTPAGPTAVDVIVVSGEAAVLGATDSAAVSEGAADTVVITSDSAPFSESKKKFEHLRRELEQLLIPLREFSRKFALVLDRALSHYSHLRGHELVLPGR